LGVEVNPDVIVERNCGLGIAVASFAFFFKKQRYSGEPARREPHKLKK